jgi:enoyl-CoA hydratase
MTSLVRYDVSEGIATVTLDDGKANALGPAMLAALNDALDRAESDHAVVVLAGRERMFSGGFDLSLFKGERAALLHMLEAGARLAERLLAFPRPVIAACTGHAIAMGAFVLLCADLRIGVDGDTRIQVNEVHAGLTLPHFAIELCQRRLSPAHLPQIVLAASPCLPMQAMAAGFLDEVVAPAELDAVVRQRAQAMAALNATAFGATKQRLRYDTLTALRNAIDQDLADWRNLFLA